jgi:hypothetical protein
VTVEGKVTFDGKPLEGAAVIFIPKDGGVGASALTDAEGAFRLIGTQADGLVPGEYRVTVSKRVFPPGMKPPDDPRMLTIPMVEKMVESLPVVYTLQDKTPLRVTVPSGGPKNVEVALNRQGT